MKRALRSLAVIMIIAVAFTMILGSAASVYDNGQAYAASNLSKPKISLRTSGNKITVSWDKVSGAKKYKVAYKLSTAKKWTYKTTKKLKFTIKGKYNKKYKIKVRAIKGDKKSKWSRTATRKTGKQKVPTGKTYDLSKPSKLKNYSSFRIGKTYKLKDPMGTGRTKKVKVDFGDIVNISGEGVSVSVSGVTDKGFDYSAQISSRVITYSYGKDPMGTLETPDPQEILNGNTLGTVTNDSKGDEITDPGTGSTGNESGNSNYQLPDISEWIGSIGNNAGTGTETPGIQLPDLSNINIPGVDLSNIDWSQVQLPDITDPNAQLPEVNIPDIQLPEGQLPSTQPPDAEIPEIKLPSGNDTQPTDGSGDASSPIPGVDLSNIDWSQVQLPGNTTTPENNGETGNTGNTDNGSTPKTQPTTDINSVVIPETFTVCWTLDDTQPKKGQADLVNAEGNKVRGTVSNLAEMLALRQLQADSNKPVWIKIYQGKKLVYESYTKRLK